MKIVITGANGAVGQAILRVGTQQEPGTVDLVAGVRSARAVAEPREQYGAGIEVAQIVYEDPASLDEAFLGASAVIHLAGILFESPGSTYESANLVSTGAVVEAAKRCGLQKIVFVSATGADETSRNRYYRTKGQAERLVRESKISYTVLRAPLLLGQGTAGGDALKRHISHAKAKLIDGGRNLQQPLCVDDLARGALAAATPAVAKDQVLEFIGPNSVPDWELVRRAATLQGREVEIRSIPKTLFSLGISARRLFKKGGFSHDVLEVITADTKLDPRPAASALGIELTSVEQMVQESLGKKS